MSAFTKEVLEAYLREDLEALGDPLRRDEAIILQDLRFLFRAYGQHFKTVEDWVPASPVPSGHKRGEENA